MTDNVDRLRRLAYGPGSRPEDRAAAETELRQLEGETRKSGPVAPEPSGVEPSGVGPLPQVEADLGGISGVMSVADGNTDPEPTVVSPGRDPAVPIWRRSIRVAWLIPIVVGAVLIGVLATMGVAGQFDAGARWSAPVASGNPQTQGSGDLSAADAWFEKPITDADLFTYPELSDSNGIASDQVRFALDGGNGYMVWVGRTDRQLCLLISQEGETNGAVSCFDRDRFVAAGAHLAVDGRKAYWYGHEVTADPAILSSGPNATVPPLPSSGPGNIEAANSWFDSPADESDPFPDAGSLDGIGVALKDVRSAGESSGSPYHLWIAKQGTTGFCLIATKEAESEATCKSFADFESSGLSIQERGFSAFWNGTGASTSY